MVGLDTATVLAGVDFAETIGLMTGFVLSEIEPLRLRMSFFGGPDGVVGSMGDAMPAAERGVDRCADFGGIEMVGFRGAVR